MCKRSFCGAIVIPDQRRHHGPCHHAVTMVTWSDTIIERDSCECAILILFAKNEYNFSNSSLQRVKADKRSRHQQVIPPDITHIVQDPKLILDSEQNLRLLKCQALLLKCQALQLHNDASDKLRQPRAILQSHRKNRRSRRSVEAVARDADSQNKQAHDYLRVRDSVSFRIAAIVLRNMRDTLHASTPAHSKLGGLCCLWPGDLHPFSHPLPSPLSVPFPSQRSRARRPLVCRGRRRGAR